MSSNGRIDSLAESSAAVREALALARRTHAGQLRQTGSGEIPFIEHPLAVADLLAEHGHSEEVVIAGLLHDAIEHAETEPDELRKLFGEEIAELVEALTEDETISDYEERKDEHRERVAAASAEARAIFAADKAVNVATLRRAYEAEGEGVDTRLPVSLDRKILVWEYDLEMLFDASPGVPLVDLLADELVGLWGQRAAEERASLT
jgi:(p)ppGpp synthase/HD superfamily hydrolase